MTAKNRKEAEPVFCQVAALRYAKVLNELGLSKEAVLEAGNIFEKSQELKAALVNPVITKETKRNIIDKVFSEEMRTFLKVVCGNTIPLREVVIMFYICNEALSLLENAAVFVPIPDKLRDVLIQLRDKDTEEDSEGE